jgi:hypothetical protein
LTQTGRKPTWILLRKKYPMACPDWRISDDWTEDACHSQPHQRWLVCLCLALTATWVTAGLVMMWVMTSLVLDFHMSDDWVEDSCTWQSRKTATWVIAGLWCMRLSVTLTSEMTGVPWLPHEWWAACSGGESWLWGSWMEILKYLVLVISKLFSRYFANRFITLQSVDSQIFPSAKQKQNISTSPILCLCWKTPCWQRLSTSPR